MPLLADGFDLLPKPALVVERSSTVIAAANGRAASLLTGDQSPVGRPLVDFTRCSMAELRADLRVAASGHRMTVDLLADGSSSTRYYGQVTPHDRDGTTYWVVLLDDLDPARTKFAVLSERLRESNDRARTLATANRELRETKDRLAAVNTDLEYFTHVAAHDLREPCRRQLMLATMLHAEHHDELSEPVHRYLGLLVEQSSIMLGLITAFRELADMAGPAIERSPIRLGDLAASLVRDLVPGDLRDQVTIDLPSEVTGYQPLVRVLLQNLLVNAVGHGDRPLDLRLCAERFHGDWLYSVSNRSATDPDPDRDLLLPFVRGDDETGGSGLGLSICKRVVQRHQGRIWVEASPGVFRVRFTLRKDDE